MADLTYRSFAAVESLVLNECTIHSCAGNGSRAGFWHLWFYVARETDGVPEVFCVPVIPRGAYTENGPGGRSWGLADVGGGVWQIAPSINIVQDGDAKAIHAGPHPTLPSLWHQTPRIVGVQAGERWQS